MLNMAKVKIVGDYLLGSEGAAGIDLYAKSIEYDVKTGIVKYGTGVKVEIPEGYVGLLFPRSSVCKKNLQLANSVGVIDSDYRGEIFAVFRATHQCLFGTLEWIKKKLFWFFGKKPKFYELGDRVCQLVIIPTGGIEFVDTTEEELSESERGTGGFGSTGR